MQLPINIKTSFLFLFLFFASVSQAAFEQTSQRYLSGKDYFLVFKSHFQVVKDGQFSQEKSCMKFTDSTEGLLGFSSPALGRPSSPKPTPAFVTWYSRCTMAIVKAEFAQIKANNFSSKLLSKFTPKALISSPPKAGFEKTPWNALSPKLQDSVLSHLINEFIGPEEILQDLGWSDSPERYAESIRKSVESKSENLTLWEALQGITITLMLREEFIRY